MTGKHQDLLPVLGEVDQRVDRGFSPDLIEVDDDIVENHRQVDSASGKLLNHRQSNRQEQLLAGAAAQVLDTRCLSLIVVNQQPTLAQRNPDVPVLPTGQAVQVLGRLLERFRLTVALQAATHLVDGAGRQTRRGPVRRCIVELGFDLCSLKAE